MNELTTDNLQLTGFTATGIAPEFSANAESPDSLLMAPGANQLRRKSMYNRFEFPKQILMYATKALWHKASLRKNNFLLCAS